jgi:ATP-binding cassette subfamily B protein
LFEGSVVDNIKFCLDKTEEEVVEICKQIDIDYMISSLPHGYQTIITDDNNFSSGEKQLLTIARCMLQNNPIVILDEATSNIDTRTELKIQNALDKLTAGRTSFVIAHRLSTIKNADLIIVLKDGKIIETGNHNQLIQNSGFYTNLYKSQFSIED